MSMAGLLDLVVLRGFYFLTGRFLLTIERHQSPSPRPREATGLVRVLMPISEAKLLPKKARSAVVKTVRNKIAFFILCHFLLP